MASIVNSQFSSLDHQCLLSSTLDEASTGTLLFEGEGSKNTAINNTAGSSSIRAERI